MSLKALKEMLELNEAPKGQGLVRSFKQGYDDARVRQERVKQIVNRDEREAKQAGGKGQPKTKQAVKAKPTPPVKVNLQDVADDINQYLDDLFTKFPNSNDEEGAKSLLANHPSVEARRAAVEAFQTLSSRIKELRTGLNKSLLRSGMVSQAEIIKFNDEAKRLAGANAPAPSQALTRFVKKESKFFTTLVKVTDNLTLNDRIFKELLQLKIKQTEGHRVPDAAQALNHLLGYMESEFKRHAALIEAGVGESERDERAARIAARKEADAAKAAPEEDLPNT